ncbi:hypothetical protein [Leptolyngbya sp. NM2-A1]|uniref:hypothetical protein n=1 Tax=Leptolyngbya sp. NM2-A1 TaxID=2933909 RepID=UPI0032981389
MYLRLELDESDRIHKAGNQRNTDPVSASEAEAPYIYRSQAKAGTTSFFAYATVYVICRNKRVT